jgi:hypothetical protein
MAEGETPQDDMTQDEARAILVEKIRRAGLRQRYRSYKWSPHEPTARQSEYLALVCREALYGGAAGGGKSDALLMAALQYVHVPGYAALVLRRTFADLMLPEAIMSRAHDWLCGSPATWSNNYKRWTFPSGATLSFGYLNYERDKYRYQSAAFQFVGFDELTQFTETQYLYLFSRLRRLEGVGVPLRMRTASNPGNIGHEWVKRRFLSSPSHEGRAFVPATLVDNPYIDQEAYAASLDELDEITRMQLKNGIWIRDDGGLVYKFDADRNLVDARPERHPVSGEKIDWKYIWVIDFGSSERNATEAVAVLAFAFDMPEIYVVESRKRASRTLDETHEEYLADKLLYGGFYRVMADQGGLGAKFSRELQIRYHMPVEPVDKNEKLGYRRLLNGDLENGRLLFVAGKTDELVNEINELTWDKRGLDAEPGRPDHCSDAMLYGWREARANVVRAREPLPQPGTAEYYQREAQEARKRAMDRVNRGGREFWEWQ